MKRSAPIQRHVKHLLAETDLRIAYAEQELQALRHTRQILQGQLNGLDIALADGLDLAHLSQSKAAEVVLRQHGPLPCMEIVDRLLASGYPGPTGGSMQSRRARLGNSLFSTMRKQPHRFYKDPQHVWHLVTNDKPSNRGTKSLRSGRIKKATG